MKKLFISSLLLASSAWSQVNLKPVYDHLKKGDYQEVINILESYKNKEKQFLGTKHYLLALSFARMQDFDPAIENFKKALRFGNKGADIYYELGQALYAMNELEKSRKAFYHSVKKGFKKSQSNYYIAHISQLLEDSKNAKKFYENILKDREATIELRQIARFQLAEVLLEKARKKENTRDYVAKYILPQLKKSLSILEKGSTARDIKKRINEVQREFDLDPNLLMSGRRMPTKRFKIGFNQSVSYDNNFTSTNDLPSSRQSKSDTYISSSELEIEKVYVFKRRYVLSTGLGIEHTIHSDRENSVVFSEDSYEITPELDLSYEHKAFGKPARILLNYLYTYNAQDREGTKNKIFNNRNNRITIGQKFKYFSFGDTTYKFKYKTFRSYSDTLHNNVQTFSLDQLIIKNGRVYVALWQYDKTEYTEDETLNTTSNLLRVDYIHPNILTNLTLNLAASATFLSYDDPATSEERGTEILNTFSTKFTKSINENISLDVDYTYTTNSSDVEESNYSKHVTTFEIDFNW